MKKSFFSISFIFGYSIVLAQWNQAGDSYTTGRVSIGTNVFSDRLSIEGTSEWQIRLKDKGAGGLDWRIGSTGNLWAAGGGKFLISNSNSSMDAAFAITSQKYIGIGTLYPSARLEIVGGIKVSDYAGGGHNIIVNNGYGGAFNTVDE